MYEKIGISHFKLSCRTMPFEWFYDVVLAYVNREYDGNLIRLLGITPPGLEIRPEKLIHLDNKYLNGFLKQWLAAHDKERYSKEKITQMFNEGKFEIDEEHGGEYSSEDGELRLTKSGRYFGA